MAKESMRNKKKKPTLGERLAPILNEIEETIIEHKVMVPGEIPGYSDDAFRAAICIFLDVALNKMWDYQSRLDMPIEAREEAVERFGKEFRMLIFRYCDIATEKLL